MIDAAALRRGDLARVGVFLHGGRFLTSPLVDSSTQAQANPSPQNWTVIGSGTAAACLVYAITSTATATAGTAVAPKYLLQSESRTSGALPGPVFWRGVVLDESSLRAARQAQISRNAAAVSLLDNWLVEGGGAIDKDDAHRFDALRKSLDSHRSSNRKLFK